MARLYGLSALNRKVLRDLWRLRGQVLAIALVMASGIGVLIMSLSSIEALEETTAAYYERYRFADVFATVERAPERLAPRLAALRSVQSVDTRIVKFATLDLPGFAEPVTGLLQSLPEGAQPRLNRLVLRSGRLVEPGRVDEVVVSEPFAEAHGLRPGDAFSAIINGHRRTLTISGIALSPEYVYAIGPGQLMPDEARFGVLWMGREALAAAFDLDGAFNSVALSLLPSADTQAVIRQVDDLLERYGGTGAIARADQISNWFLLNEIEQLETIARILPTIFLIAAAFLTNMVVARLVATERSEIGLLKAFGYTHIEVAWHYVKLVLVITAVGIVIGIGLGLALGRYNTEVYAERLFDFPFFHFRPGAQVFVLAGLLAVAAALLAALGAVYRAATLAPAEAMRPPAPTSFSRGLLGRGRLGRALDQPTHMIVRQILRWPGRSAGTVAGVAMAVAVLTTTLQWWDSLDHMVEVYFFQAQRQDATVVMDSARASTATARFADMPGVLAAEPSRSVMARLTAGALSKREALVGVPSDAALWPIYDTDGQVLPAPAEGLVVATKLAEILRIEAGDWLTLEVLEGRRPKLEVPVVATFETYIGTPAYMSLTALNRLMRERPSVDMVHLVVDPDAEPALFAELKQTPKVYAVMLKRTAIETFNKTVGETILIFIGFFTVFACMLAGGVVYNGARIALSERGRELATLRVLGFTRWEISYILLGQTALLTLFALPLGCVLGYALVWLMTSAFDTELFRVPMVIEADTFGVAVAIVLAAALVSALIVRHRLDRLDLIAVLKTRE